RQGRAGQGDDAGAIRCGARVDGGERRGSVEAARYSLSRRVALRGRYGICRGEELRPRSLAARTGEVPRDLLVLQLRNVSGSAPGSQVPADRWRPDRLLSYVERIRAGRRPDADRGDRELPGGRRLRNDSEGTPSLHERDRANRSCRLNRRYGG